MNKIKMTPETFRNGKYFCCAVNTPLFVHHATDKCEINWKYLPHAHFLRVVSSSVDQLVSCDLVVWATLGWGHPRQENAGLWLGLTLELWRLGGNYSMQGKKALQWQIWVFFLPLFFGSKTLEWGAALQLPPVLAMICRSWDKGPSPTEVKASTLM